MHLGRFTEAREYIVRHLEHAKRIGDMPQLVDALIHQADLEIRTKNYDGAIEVLSQATELAENNRLMPHLYRCHELSAAAYKAVGDFANALACHEQYHQIKEKVFNLENEQKFKQLESVHQISEAQQEAEIYRLKTIELEERVQERTRELAQSLSREADLNQLSARIIDNISHEFRTPLAIINATANMLQRYAEQLDTDAKHEYQERIVEQVSYLDALLDDVTFVSRTNRQEISPSYMPYSFAQLAKELKQAWSLDFGNKVESAIQFDEDDHSIIMVDPILWQQIGHNLLSNSVKYGGDDADIQIEMAMDGARIRLQVIDEGIGIPAGEEKTIFEPLYRGSNVNSVRGMGLGLNIVKNLAEAMGGTITVSSPGIEQGSTFTLIVPSQPLK